MADKPVEKEFWITRDDNLYAYKIFGWSGNRKPTSDSGAWDSVKDYLFDVCYTQFYRLFKIRMEKGQIKKVKIRIEEVV